ncbi:MAG: energy-coupling factor transporter transmembrane protein EcfT [Bryobacteraceae bacterium]|nr:energy-coupling factor transporter transmembrane protein EcfT [Bryobacteraceae bacterium]
MSEGLHHLVHRRKGFLDRTLGEISHVVDRSFSAELSAAQGGLLQGVDARVKLAGAALLILTAAATPSHALVAGIGAVAVGLALASRLRLGELTTLWTGVLLFSGVIALPALFLTPGEPWWRVPILGWTVTTTGFRTATLLLARVLTTSTLGSVLVSTTPWHALLRAMRAFRLPVVAVVLIGMTYRYIFLFIQTTLDMLEGRQSRLAGELPAAQRRGMAVATVGVLMSKAFELSGDVHLAMQARGYRGEVHVLDEAPLRPLDWLMISALTVLCAGVLWR